MSPWRSSGVDHFVMRISTMPFAPVAVLLMLMAQAVILSGSVRPSAAGACACVTVGRDDSRAQDGASQNQPESRTHRNTSVISNCQLPNITLTASE